MPLGFVVLKAGVTRPDAEIEGEIAALVRERIGPIARFKRTLVVDRLPKTRSGEILRQAMRGLADGKPVATPPTIDDPAALDEIGAALKQAGF